MAETSLFLFTGATSNQVSHSEVALLVSVPGQSSAGEVQPRRQHYATVEIDDDGRGVSEQ